MGGVAGKIGPLGRATRYFTLPIANQATAILRTLLLKSGTDYTRTSRWCWQAAG